MHANTANRIKPKSLSAKKQIKMSLRSVCGSRMPGTHFVEMQVITKTRLYNFDPILTPINFDPIKPHFHIVKQGFTGVCIIFLFLLENIDCGYSLEPPRPLCFEQKYDKFQSFYLKILR